MLSLAGQHSAAVAVYDQSVSPNTQLSGQTIGRLVFSLSELALPDRAIALASAFLQTARSETWDTAVILNALGVLYNGTGRYTLAEATFSRIIALLETTFGGRRVFVALRNRAITRKWQGRFHDAQADARQALELAAEAGDALMMAGAHTLLGEIAFEWGQYAEAEEHYLASCEGLEHLDDSQHSAEAHGRLSELYVAWELPRNRMLALKHAHLALGQLRSQGSPTFLTNGLFWAAQAEARTGRPERALAYADEACAIADQSPSLAHTQNACWARGAALKALGRYEEAHAAFGEAAAAARQLGHLVEVQKLGLETDWFAADIPSVRTRIAWFEARGLRDGIQQAYRLFPELSPAPVAPARLAHIHLKALGPLLLRYSSEEHPVRGAKCQELLLLLLEHRMVGAPEVPLLFLLETLYPHVAERSAEALLRQLVFQTRGRLGQDLIVTTPGGYALGDVDSDAEAFLSSGATELWRGSYRATAPREGDGTVTEALYRALAARLEPLVAQQPTEAARIGRLLLEADPYDTESLRLTLTALRAEGHHKNLSRLYAVSRARFLEVGEHLPATWQAFLEQASPA
ncbi:tetratricopeptide repeat protein [Deinococcus ruber]|uniref:MalT-like TPR region domain-containing protein n=1 Tax=Deinococcus ruber TaxID=1848197 RepID=A0A918KX25_9DEIO|nr:tetratricopeptide repeat protein [Deinococcus ruber]GGR38466.1 hypothetical protein GCM10008957_54490 [Deinococcus ruber]